ncbi:hypothetical protein HRR78_008621, partial [Exophiala dermatitidis]
MATTFEALAKPDTTLQCTLSRDGHRHTQNGLDTPRDVFSEFDFEYEAQWPPQNDRRL